MSGTAWLHCDGGSVDGMDAGRPQHLSQDTVARQFAARRRVGCLDAGQRTFANSHCALHCQRLLQARRGMASALSIWNRLEQALKDRLKLCRRCVRQVSRVRLLKPAPS